MTRYMTLGHHLPARRMLDFGKIIETEGKLHTDLNKVGPIYIEVSEQLGSRRNHVDLFAFNAHGFRTPEQSLPTVLFAERGEYCVHWLAWVSFKAVRSAEFRMFGSAQLVRSSFEGVGAFSLTDSKPVDLWTDVSITDENLQCGGCLIGGSAMATAYLPGYVGYELRHARPLQNASIDWLAISHVEIVR